MKADFAAKARLIRKASDTSGIERTADRVIAELGRAGIPCLIVGGYAVQEHGYARFTADVDVIVPDVEQASEHLACGASAATPGLP